MKNFFNFLARHYFFFLFLALQVLSFLLIFQNNFYQRSVFINSANFLAGNLYDTRNTINEYFNLRTINEQLVEENKSLLEALPLTFLRTDKQIFSFNDTLHRRQFTYINARAINNSVQHRNNYITLNKGRLQGIKPDMGVMTHHGVVGIVKEVSANFSAVLSFLHSDIQISAKIKKNEHLGTVLWEGYDHNRATMLFIPPHVEIEKGDTIITSGFSHIFPRGILIGTVEDFEIRRGDNFYTLTIDLAKDFNRLQDVYVIKNIYREELESLEESARQN